MGERRDPLLLVTRLQLQSGDGDKLATRSLVPCQSPCVPWVSPDHPSPKDKLGQTPRSVLDTFQVKQFIPNAREPEIQTREALHHVHF